MVQTVETGHSVTDTADAAASLPKWLKWTSQGNLGGTVTTPSGFRRSVLLKSGSRVATGYFENVPTMANTEGQWQVAIFAPNRAYIFANGVTGFPIIGTPRVRLTENAPAKAVLRIPVRRGEGNILDQDFAGWEIYNSASQPYTGPVERGMEILIRFRTKGQMRSVFRGQIYQIEVGDTIEITAYDRLMDLYQFSDQYQSSQGRNAEWRPRTGSDANDYIFEATEQIGTMTAVKESDVLRIDAISTLSQGHSFTGYIAHPMPSAVDGNGVTHKAQQGDIIKKVRTMVFAHVNDIHMTNKIRIRARAILYNRISPQFAALEQVAATGWQEVEIDRGYEYMEWDVEWTVPSWGYIGAEYQTEIIHGSYQDRGATNTNTRRTISSALTSDNGSQWTIATNDWIPELAVTFTEDHDVPLASVVYSGRTVRIAKAAVPSYSGTYLTTEDLAIRAYLDYFISQGTSLQAVVRDLIEAAGQEPSIDGSIDLGTTTYYTTSTFDYLTCLQELIRGANYGLASFDTMPGYVYILPRHTTDDTPAAVLSADMDPSTEGERVIVAHSLTAHWMAEKATVAYIAENATQSGLPLALETDDELMDGSLVKALQSPLRGISADATLGTHRLMASAAGGKIVQLHTNVVEGTVTLAGYRADLWEIWLGSNAGGKPVRLIVPDAGVDAVAIPTELELGDGVTKVTLDNIRRADRSEIARSMGLTADAISNNTQSLPATCWVFAKVGTYDTQETGLTPDTVTKVQWLKDGGTIAAEQTDGGYIRTEEDAAGYFHVCAVMPASLAGYAPDNPITNVAFTMGGTVYRAVLDNPKYALGGQALHADIRFRKA